MDALSPAILTDLLESEIKAVIDMGIFKGVYEIENKWKAELSELAKNYQNTWFRCKKS